MKNIFKENDILYRRKDDVHIIKNVFDYYKIKDEIVESRSVAEEIHFFESGTASKKISDVFSFNSESNIFSLYNKNINMLLNKIKQSLQEMCIYHEINYEKMYYYISSEYVESVDSTYWYDNGGIRIPCFSGIAILDDIDSLNIKIGKTEIDLGSGDFILFESGHKVVYGQNSVSMISFNIAPLEMLKGQYPKKWIPVL